MTLLNEEGNQPTPTTEKESKVKAKDTVIGQKDSDLIRCPNCHTEWVILYNSIREKQAEISFKAGRKEVIAWLEDNIPKTLANYVGFWHQLQAQKKEWGV